MNDIYLIIAWWIAACVASIAFLFYGIVAGLGLFIAAFDTRAIDSSGYFSLACRNGAIAALLVAVLCVLLHFQP